MNAKCFQHVLPYVLDVLNLNICILVCLLFSENVVRQPYLVESYLLEKLLVGSEEGDV
ncbi:hypothetical protein HanRHA438_Chr03g0148111 [Helianthus annuus]|nr:hypothetical protein HanRHA438_Chr03g0148111 [Helianthus annuus]